jgi:hypothetical protein
MELERRLKCNEMNTYFERSETRCFEKIEKRRKIKMIRKINKKKLYSNKATRIFRKRMAKRTVKK